MDLISYSETLGNTFDTLFQTISTSATNQPFFKINGLGPYGII